MITATLLMIAATAQANSLHNCFETHLSEAIALNEERKPLYSKLTQKKSEKISRRLILIEKGTRKFIARRYDQRARPYQEKGIPLLCDEFAPMSDTPEFKAPVDPPGPPPPLLWELGYPTMTDALNEAYKAESFPGLSRASRELLHRIESYPSFFCMTRHVLESIARSADLAPRHIAQAAELKLESPAPISDGFIRNNILSLWIAIEMDRDAAPLQEQGIPILCRDVPPILKDEN